MAIVDQGTYYGNDLRGTSPILMYFSSMWGEAHYQFYPPTRYINTVSGHVYECSSYGYWMSDAYAKSHQRNDVCRWRYVETQVKHSPNVAVTNLKAPTRGANGSRTFTASWKVPSKMTDSKSCYRAESLDVSFYLKGNLGNAERLIKCENAGVSTTSASINLNNTTYRGLTYTRANFYPLSNWRLEYIEVEVEGKNRYGVCGTKYASTARAKFATPRKPTMTAIAQNADTGVVSCTIKTNAGNDLAERYDTYWTREVYNSRTKAKTVVTGSSTSTEFTLSYDASDRQALTYGQYIRVKWTCYARGYAGDSAKVSRTYYVSYPLLPTISKVTVPSRKPTDKVTVYLQQAKADVAHPTTHVKLQKLVSSSYMAASDIPASAEWADTSAVDNGNCLALSLSVADLMPDAGTRTWVRVKAWHDVEDVFYRYSEPKGVAALETPLPVVEDDTITILSLGVTGDGENALLLAWPSDQSNSVEVSWADSANAWRSTDPPETFVLDDSTWDEGSVTRGSKTYAHSATVYLRDLPADRATYVRARRAYVPTDSDSSTVYGRYCNAKTIIASGELDSAVSLAVVGDATHGRALRLSWTYDGSSMQGEWMVCSPRTSGTVGTSDYVIASSRSDPSTSCTIPWASLEPYVSTTGDASTLNSMELYVQVRIGHTGAWHASDVLGVHFATNPQVHIESVTTPVTQLGGCYVTVSCDSASAGLVLSLTSNGVSGDEAVGVEPQYAGESAWSRAVYAAWSSADDSDDMEHDYCMTVQVDADADMRDGGEYTLTARAYDPAIGLSGSDGTDTTTVAVALAHAAPTPPDTIEAEAYEDVDSEGRRELGATITLAAPTGYASTDVYDVYRVTTDGTSLVCRGAGLTDTVVDHYAPLGDGRLYYRVACRTAEGDVAWADYDYAPWETDCVRIDWQGGYVELPYNVEIDHGYGKDFEARHHLGARRPEGYWGDAYDRSLTVKADLVRSLSDADRAALHALGSHNAPCLVRTPDGAMFEADVELSSMPTRHNSAAVSVGLSCVEVAPTSMYMGEVSDDE